MMTKKFLTVNQKVFGAFVDLEKAFDRVVRAKLWEMLSRYNVSGPLLQAVMFLYRDQSACVGVGISSWFDILSDLNRSNRAPC